MTPQETQLNKSATPTSEKLTLVVVCEKWKESWILMQKFQDEQQAWKANGYYLDDNSDTKSKIYKMK